MYLKILFIVFQWSPMELVMHWWTAPTTCAMSGLVHTIASIKLPTANAYSTRDIFFISTSLLEHLLEGNLKIIESEDFL